MNKELKNITVVILAGGKGTRIAEESHNKPKPMIEIGGKPILWHIMKIYNHYGIKDFIICAGHKQHVIKEYFFNYQIFSSDITIKTHKGLVDGVTIHNKNCEDWNITIADTGEDTMTGGRIKRIKNYLNPDLPFLMTYGDGVCDINIEKLFEFHNSHQKLATVTGTIPSARFGALHLGKNNMVEGFIEKPDNEGGYINGGYFVLSPKIIDFIEDDKTIFEKQPLENLAKKGELMAYLHNGFWQPMDTVRDHSHLCNLWNENIAPWKVW
jgi:glucose-1-phosphate cytidylyltransferase